MMVSFLFQLAGVIAAADPTVDDRTNSDFSYSSGSVMFGFCFLTLAFAIAVKFYIDHQTKRKQNQDAVPGFPSPPNSHWLFGHLIVLHSGGGGLRPDGSPKTFIDGYQAVYVKHADPDSGRGSFWFFTVPAVYLTRGKDVKAVLSASSYRAPTTVVEIHTKQFLGKKALVNLMGKEWRLYRSAVHKSFTPKAIQQSQHIIDRVGSVLTDTLLAQVETAPSKQLTMQVLPIMKMATMDVFGVAAFNFDFRCTETLTLSPVAAAFEYLGKEYTRRLKSPWDIASWWYDLPTPANRQYKRQKNIIRTFVRNQIQEERRKLATGNVTDEVASASSGSTSLTTTTTSDVLANLVKAADSEAAKEGNAASNDEALGDVLMTLLFGGYDTTSITLSYALYLLAKHPDYQSHCIKEIEAVFGSGNGQPSKSDDDSGSGASRNIGPDQLPYMKAVIMETLRLYPPAPLTSRTLEKGIQLPPVPNSEQKPQSLEQGQLIMLPIWCIQRDPHNFPHPDEMLPGRWVQKSKSSENIPGHSPWKDRPYNEGDDDRTSLSVPPSNETIPAGNRDAFCAFAAGGRNCVGRVLAMQEAVTLLASLIRRLKFELVASDYQVRPTNAAVIQQPSDGLPMIISKR
ncbi:cytochrome P450 [Nitzschia inconspicua]|uniref:Cytochrome P450 n=1 Tax=Nitzschia inconspicua TaxID=303405 RepID=A0A9K3LHJ1_9STRA|nr:cytochrome P450 [Nitzschia inconspicua]